MARKPKKKKTRRKSNTPSMARRLAGQMFRPRRLCVVAPVLAALVSWPFVRPLFPDLGERSEYAITVDQIRVTPPPPWVPEDIVEQVQTRAGLPERMSLLDDGLVQLIADGFLRHPWIKSVERVEKSYPARVDVVVTYREPVGLVEVQDGLYPIDADAVLLPPRDFTIADVDRYPVIVSVHSVPVGSVGRFWGDPVVLGAARIAEILMQTDRSGEPYWSSLGIDRIAAPSRLSADDKIEDLVYRLRTPGGSSIVWGRAPGTGYPGEVSASRKILRLERYVADYGGFETSMGPSEVDIRHWQEISHRALATGARRTDRRHQ